jgi:hypothetical protein
VKYNDTTITNFGVGKFYQKILRLINAWF